METVGEAVAGRGGIAGGEEHESYIRLPREEAPRCWTELTGPFSLGIGSCISSAIGAGYGEVVHVTWSVE